MLRSFRCIYRDFSQQNTLVHCLFLNLSIEIGVRKKYIDRVKIDYAQNHFVLLQQWFFFIHFINELFICVPHETFYMGELNKKLNEFKIKSNADVCIITPMWFYWNASRITRLIMSDVISLRSLPILMPWLDIVQIISFSFFLIQFAWKMALHHFLCGWTVVGLWTCRPPQNGDRMKKHTFTRHSDIWPHV